MRMIFALHSRGFRGSSGARACALPARTARVRIFAWAQGVKLAARIERGPPDILRFFVPGIRQAARTSAWMKNPRGWRGSGAGWDGRRLNRDWPWHGVLPSACHCPLTVPFAAGATRIGRGSFREILRADDASGPTGAHHQRREALRARLDRAAHASIKTPALADHGLLVMR